MSEKIPIRPANPPNFHELHSNPYGVQNMLLAQVNFPSYFLKGEDKYEAWYSDRIYDRWYRACAAQREEAKGDSFVNCTGEDLLVFGQAVAGDIMKVTGVAIVRYTNVSSGYPCPLIYVVEQGPTKRQMGFPLIKQPKLIQVPNIYGGFDIQEQF